MSTFEELDEKMDAGYLFAMTRNTLEAANTWLEAWRTFIDLVDEKGTKTLEGFDEIFNGKRYVSNWVPDFERVLKEVSEIDLNYHKITIKICTEYIKRFDDGTPKSINLNYKRSFCNSLFAFGEELKSEEYFMMWLKKEPSWTDGWINWSDCWMKYSEGTKKDYRKAASILNMALEQKKQMDGKIPIYDKLIIIYEKLKDKEKVQRMKELKKDAWGEE